MTSWVDAVQCNDRSVCVASVRVYPGLRFSASCRREHAFHGGRWFRPCQTGTHYRPMAAERRTTHESALLAWSRCSSGWNKSQAALHFTLQQALDNAQADVVRADAVVVRLTAEEKAARRSARHAEDAAKANASDADLNVARTRAAEDHVALVEELRDAHGRLHDLRAARTTAGACCLIPQ